MRCVSDDSVHCLNLGEQFPAACRSRLSCFIGHNIKTGLPGYVAVRLTKGDKGVQGFGQPLLAHGKDGPHYLASVLV